MVPYFMFAHHNHSIIIIMYKSIVLEMSASNWQAVQYAKYSFVHTASKFRNIPPHTLTLQLLLRRWLLWAFAISEGENAAHEQGSSMRLTLLALGATEP